MKRMITWILTLSMIFMLCACGNPNRNDDAEPSEAPQNVQSEDEMQEMPQQPEIRALQDNDIVTIDDFCEFTVIGWENVDAITANGMKMITRDMNDDSKTIVLLKLDYTNTSTEEQSVNLYAERARESDVLQSAKLTFDGDYTYDGGSASWSDLTPLANAELYIIFTVPKTVVESVGSIILEFQIQDQAFTYTVR